MAQPAAPTTRGKRVPLVAAPAAGVADKADDVYVCGSKPLDFGELTLTAGVEVPGAASWTRIDAWVGARRVRKINPGEKHITFAEFTAALGK